MPENPLLAVTVLETTAYARAAEIAALLKCNVLEATDPAIPIQICVSTSEIALQIQTLSKKPFLIDFTKGKTGYRRRHQTHSPEFIAKAVGIKRNHTPYIVDATAGFGEDGVLLAGFGCRVILLEQHPIVYLLLADGLRRLQLAEPNLSIECIHTDASVWLAKLTPDEMPDVIYLDPMYPARRKSAAVKKEMQVLQYLVGSTPEETMKPLLDLARRTAKHRVVVKRPVWAPPLADQTPDAQLLRKTTRYDLYFS